MKYSPTSTAALLAAVGCVLIIRSQSYPLNQTCSPPPSQGGTGYCGPSFCANAATNLPPCIFTSTKTFNYPSIVAGTKSKSCTQSNDPRCSSAALAKLMFGQGIKAAYCNDQFLVILSDGTTGFPSYLGSVMFPPAATSSNGTKCVTRYKNPGFGTAKIPLYPVLLNTSDLTINNVNTKSFPNGASIDGDAAYMTVSEKHGGATYGLPTRGAIGISIGGQDIFPAFNNVGYLAPQKCEVDTCNEHVGGGGGQPHLHGDPFGSWCLYSAANYSSPYVHPPQIGWAFDGPSIYGRHISKNNLGYSVALDQCGGHIHGTFAYHYHAQVLSSVTNLGVVNGQSQGINYYASTTGPYQCLKGDISTILNYWGPPVISTTYANPDTTEYMCTGTTNYYQAQGIVLPNTVSGAPSAAPSGPSATPSVTPVYAPPATSVPSAMPTAPPTSTPSVMPTVPPTSTPSMTPTASPTLMPTSAAPTAPPSGPSFAPTLAPTPMPTTAMPSPNPTTSPTAMPSMMPTPMPSPNPSTSPTAMPSMMPTPMPSPNPSTSPTAMPSMMPTPTPSATPTTMPTNPMTTFAVSQAVVGVVLTTPAQTASFTIAFQNSVATILGIQPSAVVIISISATTSRRLMDTEERMRDVGNYRRPFLEAVGVSVSYTVTAISSTALNIANTIIASNTQLSTALVTAGFVGASAQTAFVNTFAPSAAPIKAPTSASCVTKSNFYLTLSVLVAAFCFNLL